MSRTQMARPFPVPAPRPDRIGLTGVRKYVITANDSTSIELSLAFLTDHIESSHQTGWIAIQYPCPHWAVYRAGVLLDTVFSEADARELLAGPTWLTWPLWRLAACCACLVRVTTACYRTVQAAATAIDARFV